MVAKFSDFNIFSNESILLKEYSFKGEVYKVYYFGGNATANQTIQIKTYDNSGSEYMVEVIEGYNKVEDFDFLNDTTIRVVLLDSKLATNRSDTILVNIE